MNEELANLKQKFGRLAVVELEGQTLAFRPFDRAKITQLRKSLTKSPELALDLMTGALKNVCVYGKDAYDEIANEYPLLIAGDDSIGEALMNMARGEAKVTIR